MLTIPRVGRRSVAMLFAALVTLSAPTFAAGDHAPLPGSGGFVESPGDTGFETGFTPAPFFNHSIAWVRDAASSRV